MLPSQRLAAASRTRAAHVAAAAQHVRSSSLVAAQHLRRSSGGGGSSNTPQRTPFQVIAPHWRLHAAGAAFSTAAPALMPRSKGGKNGAFDSDEALDEEEHDEDELDDFKSKAGEAATDVKITSPVGSSNSASGTSGASSDGGEGASSSSGGAAAAGGSGKSSGSGSGSSGSGDGKGSSSTSVSRQTVPAVYPQVLALPITRRPLFPGFYKAVVIKDPNVCAAIKESMKRGQPYVGAFLLKDETDDADIITDMSKVHKVGVFAQITSVFPANGGRGDNSEEEGLTAVLYPHRRISIDELIHPPGKQGSGEPAAQDVSEPVAPPFQTSFLHDFPISLVNVTNLETPEFKKESDVVRAVKAELIGVFKDIAQLNPLFRDQISNFSISQGAGNVFEEPDKLADFAAAVSSGEVEELQAVLEALNIEDRLQKALLVLKKELLNAQLQAKITKDVDAKIQKRQREYYLQEQLKALKKELGLESDGKDRMMEKFKEKANSLNMPEAVRKVFDEELSKLLTLEPAASEFNVTRGYLDWLTNIPWGVHSPENYSIANATTVLNDDHYGLKDVKDRILEFLAVGKLRGTVEGKIICLVGPPGVGKTSIGKSIARAVERQFFRFSVGGLSDVAEIKGHRRTYVGAMPGKAIQALKKVGTENPLVLIDEVDKIGRGHNGDPSSALLEMLDPEQNGSFLDHYMDVPVDLSRVLFVCTANTLDTIPQPLLDRMEVIEVSSYTADEKQHIAKGYLAPQAKEASGLQNANVTLPDETIEFLIKHHARESGVRNMKKLLEKVYRKIAFQIVKEHGETVFPEPELKAAPAAADAEPAPAAAATADAEPAKGITNLGDEPKVDADPKPASSGEGEAAPSATPKVTTEPRKPMEVPNSVNVEITIESLRDYLGPPVYHKDRLYTRHMPAGVSTGLGYLGNGSGSLMPIETTIMPGKGGLQLTGKLGDVIKESASIALSWMKSNAFALGVTKDEKTSLLDGRDVHLHMPEGSIGKEGPSAGVAFTTSLVSLLTDRALPTDLAMTGEVSLRGMVLPVGGLKEKLLAAHRGGIKKLILPAQNRPNVEADVPPEVLAALDIHYVANVWSALDVAFGEGPWSERARTLRKGEDEEAADDKRIAEKARQDARDAKQDAPAQDK